MSFKGKNKSQQSGQLDNISSLSRPLTRNQPILLPGEEAARGPQLDSELAFSGLTTNVPSLNVKHTLTLEDINTDDAGHTRNSSNTSTKSQTSVGYSSQSSQQAHSRQSSEDSQHNRNPSAGSSDTGIFGSMEKNKGRRVDKGGRVDPEEVINELMEDIQLDNMAVPEGKT